MDKQYVSRIETDYFFAQGSFAYSGVANEMIRFVEKIQLKDKNLWRMVCEQFSMCSDEKDDGWRGEYWGKLMRGACLTYQYTKDEELYAILSETVRELLSCQDECGRLSTYRADNEFRGWDMWGRKYVLLGLLHFHEICREDSMKSEVLTAAERHLDYIAARIGKGKINITDTSPVLQGINSSSILEPVMRMYNLTGKKAYLSLAEHIVETGAAKECNIFELAYQNEFSPYQYPVTKAYEMMSCFEGLLEYYRVTKCEKWKTAAENFAARVIEDEVTVIGGAGCQHELFNHSVLMQTYGKYDGLMLETCVTVTWMKLCFQLLCLTGESKYADQIERSAYNALYGAVNTEGSVCDIETTRFDLPQFTGVYQRHTEANRAINNGGQAFDSYSPVMLSTRGRAVGGFRDMRGGSAYCGCCIAIGAAGLALIPQVSVMRSHKGFAFSMYLNGTAEVTGENGRRVRFQVNTEYPILGGVSIAVQPEISEEFEIMLRIPDFSRDNRVAVNGEELEAPQSGSYYKIKRKWHAGDVIVLILDMNVRLMWGMENPDDADSKNHIAVLYGPLVLARDARMGEVGTSLRITDTKLKLQKVDAARFRALCAFDVTLDGQTFTMTDYSSCGKTWDDKSATEVWMRTKEGRKTQLPNCMR